MAEFKMRYTVPVDVEITVDAAAEDEAFDKADRLGKQYAATVWSSVPGVIADAMWDAMEPYEIEPKGDEQ